MAPRPLTAVPIFDLQAERDHLARQLTDQIKFNYALDDTLSKMTTAFWQMEKRLQVATREIQLHGDAIARLHRRVVHPDGLPAMPGYVEQMIVNVNPRRPYHITRTGDIFSVGKDDLLFSDQLLKTTFRIGGIIWDILRFHPSNLLDDAFHTMTEGQELDFYQKVLRPWMPVRDVQAFKDYALKFVHTADAILAHRREPTLDEIQQTEMTEEERRMPMFPRLWPLHSRSPTWSQLLTPSNVAGFGHLPDHLTKIDNGSLAVFLTPVARTFVRALIAPALDHGGVAQFLQMTWTFDSFKHRNKNQSFNCVLRILRLHILVIASRIAVQSFHPGTYDIASNVASRVFYPNVPWTLENVYRFAILDDQNRKDVDAYKPEEFRKLFDGCPPDRFASKINTYAQISLHSLSKPPAVPHRLWAMQKCEDSWNAREGRGELYQVADAFRMGTPVRIFRQAPRSNTWAPMPNVPEP